MLFDGLRGMLALFCPCVGFFAFAFCKEGLVLVTQFGDESTKCYQLSCKLLDVSESSQFLDIRKGIYFR